MFILIYLHKIILIRLKKKTQIFNHQIQSESTLGGRGQFNEYSFWRNIMEQEANSGCI